MIRLLSYMFPMLAMIASGCVSADDKPPGAFRPSLSSDNQTILFDYCIRRVGCTIGEYHLPSGKLALAKERPGYFWTGPYYGPQEERIYFAEGLNRSATTQIVSIQRSELERSDVVPEPLTSSAGLKSRPAISPDGRFAIFIKSTGTRWDNQQPNDWELFEVEIGTLRERQVTNKHFYSVSRASFLAGGNQILFSGDGHTFTRQARQTYKQKYKENSIFVIGRLDRYHTLSPYLVRGDHSSSPHASRDGSRIVFVSRTNDLDNPKTGYVYDVFLHEGGETSRLTNLQANLDGLAISPDGTHAVFVQQEFSRGQQDDRVLWLLQIDTKQLRRIDLPLRKLD